MVVYSMCTCIWRDDSMIPYHSSTSCRALPNQICSAPNHCIFHFLPWSCTLNNGLSAFCASCTKPSQFKGFNNPIHSCIRCQLQRVWQIETLLSNGAPESLHIFTNFSYALPGPAFLLHSHNISKKQCFFGGTIFSSDFDGPFWHPWRAPK